MGPTADEDGGRADRRRRGERRGRSAGQTVPPRAFWAWFNAEGDNKGEPFATSGGRPDVPVYAWTNPNDSGIYQVNPDKSLVRLSP